MEGARACAQKEDEQAEEDMAAPPCLLRPAASHKSLCKTAFLPSSSSPSSFRGDLLMSAVPCCPRRRWLSAGVAAAATSSSAQLLSADPVHRDGVLHAARISLSNCLSETHLDLTVPGMQSKSRGKVRDIYEVGEYLVLVTTDRQSAFDRVLASIPFKGQVVSVFPLYMVPGSLELYFLSACSEYPDCSDYD
ncbi:hypothetical protein Taro_032293 [Colocasia esculenta]|uniref:phosphoribosylaminoimidazolesuccinocarboxamide synthase n=1 Tax=Colocasia esculenta TaxID=4460 RepID=A0A843VSB5_COLES|nr:hypothetical protein [Colocasia esculenta]